LRQRNRTQRRKEVFAVKKLRCTRCNKLKSTSKFTKTNGRKKKFASGCKECLSEHAKKKRNKNLVKARKKEREYKQKQRKDPNFRKLENKRSSAQYQKDKKSPKKMAARRRSSKKSDIKHRKKNARTDAIYYQNVTKPKIQANKKLHDIKKNHTPKDWKRRSRRKKTNERQQKQEAFTICSWKDKPECSRCKVNDLSILSIHHRNGRKEFKQMDEYADKLCREIIKYVEKNDGNKPPGLQTLCHNCHHKIEANKRRRLKNKLPRKKKKRRRQTKKIILEKKRKLRRRHQQKKEALTLCSFKGKLECSNSSCKVNDMDILTLHHRKGRKKLGHKDMEAEQLYRWVLDDIDQNKKPSSEIETLCYNHHFKRKPKRGGK